MPIEIINDKATWDRFVDESPHSLLFHRWDFLAIMEKYSGFKLYHLGVYRKDELVCLFPFFHRKHLGMSLIYSPPQGSLLYVPYLGPIMGAGFGRMKEHEKGRAWCDVAKEIEGAIKKFSPSYTSIALAPGIIDARPFMAKGYGVDVQYTYIIDLNPSEDEILMGFDGNCRIQIRNCNKYNLICKQVNEADTFIKLMGTHLKDEGMTYFNRQDSRYLREIMDAFPKNVNMHFLYYGEDIISAYVNCDYRDRSIAWMGSPAIQKDIQPNEYFLWERIKKAKENGYKKFDIWGSDIKRLTSFKAKFNPSLELTLYLERRNALRSMAEWGMNSVTDMPYISSITKLLVR